MEEIKDQINQIQERNKRVEADKAWETSWARRGFIAITTYVFAVIWLNLIHADSPLLNACIPTVGYILSTVSLESLKKRWIKNRIK